jgi:hypothetical protein
MKIKKSPPVLLLLLLTVFSIQSFAGGIQDATWYVSIDVDKVENNKIYQLLLDNKQQFSDNESFELSKIPSEISHITLYGDAKGSEDATALIHGDFSRFSLNEHILKLIYSHDEISNKIKDSVISYKKHEINVFKVDETKIDSDHKDKEIYLSKVNNGLTVISFKINEVEKWLDNVYSEKSMKNDSLFSVEVDVASALAHMGVNLDDHNFKMQSEIFKKVSQVSASLSESNDDIEVVVALNASDEANAVQIEQVINGLIAMKNLSGGNDDNQLQAEFLQNLTIERSESSILISSYASYDNVKESVLSQSDHSNYSFD